MAMPNGKIHRDPKPRVTFTDIAHGELFELGGIIRLKVSETESRLIWAPPSICDSTIKCHLQTDGVRRVTYIEFHVQD
jgi:hypothetical protein